MLDLYAADPSGHTPRPDERFHLQTGQPWCVGWGTDRLYRSVKWYGVYLEDGSSGWFNTYVLCWYVRWYVGNVKCDPTRTGMLRHGQLGEVPPNAENLYVMTTTPKEKFSLRFHGTPLNREVWTNMGSI